MKRLFLQQQFLLLILFLFIGSASLLAGPNPPNKIDQAIKAAKDKKDHDHGKPDKDKPHDYAGPRPGKHP